MRPILVCGTETWPLRADDLRRFSLFDHQCLRSIARVWWGRRIGNAEVRHMVLGRQKAHAIDKLISLHRLRWLGHVLRMPPNRLPRIAQPCAGWKWRQGEQQTTWKRSMEALTSSLSRVENCRFSLWGMAGDADIYGPTRKQCRTCIQANAFNV